jgi:hypothetical protein
MELWKITTVKSFITLAPDGTLEQEKKGLYSTFGRELNY